MSNVKTQNSPAGKGAHSNAALERSIKNMKMIIAALSLALAVSIVYILASPSDSSEEQNMMTGNPAPAQQTPPTTATQVTGDAANTPAPAQQNPASATPAPAPVTTSTTVAPVGQPSGKVNPAHGQPGHRCDIPVGNALP